MFKRNIVIFIVCIVSLCFSACGSSGMKEVQGVVFSDDSVIETVAAIAEIDNIYATVGDGGVSNNDDSTIDFNSDNIKCVDGTGDIYGVTLHISIVTASSEELLSAAELILMERELYKYQDITISDSDFNYGMITFMWSEDISGYISSCIDFTEDASFESLYLESDVFSKTDLSRITEERFHSTIGEFYLDQLN